MTFSQNGGNEKALIFTIFSSLILVSLCAVGEKFLPIIIEQKNNMNA